MSSRLTSAFDDLLEQNRRELDALYQGAGPAAPDRGSSMPAPRVPDRGTEGVPAARSSADRNAPGEPAPMADSGATALPLLSPSPAPSRPPASAPAERLLDERYGDGWQFEITSRRREGNEVIVVGTLRLPGSGAVRTQFGSAPIAAEGGGSASGSVGGVAFSFGGEAARQSPLTAEEAAFERARADALANCAALP